MFAFKFTYLDLIRYVYMIVLSSVSAFTIDHSFIHIFCIPFTGYAERTCFHACFYIMKKSEYFLKGCTVTHSIQTTSIRLDLYY